MQKFQHLLITRFNVSVDYSPTRMGLDPEWLQHRFELFDRFCYPSVQAQTNQNFQWLVYFDSATPALFKQKIQAYAKWPNFVPIFLNCPFNDDLNRQIVAQYLPYQSDYLITTRLDNDDAICTNFVQIAQAEFAEQTSEFLSFVNGYVWHNQKIYRYRYPQNPFISLIEKISPATTQPFRTILCGEHSRLAELGTLRQIDAAPAWLQVVHGRNVSNRLRGIRQPIQALQQNFSLHPELCYPSESFWPYWLDHVYSRLKLPIDDLLAQLLSQLPASFKHRLKARLSNLSV